MVSARSDLELLATWRAGDVEAGSELFKRHFTVLRRFCAALVEASVVEAFVHDIFVACRRDSVACQRDSVACQRDSGDSADRAGFRPYLFGVAIEQIQAHYQSRSQDPIDFGERSVAELCPAPNTSVARKREQAILLAALQRIPFEDHVILQLRFWDQLSTTELARLVGMPKTAMGARLRRARERFEAAIRQLDAAPELLLDALREVDEWTNTLRDRALLDPLQALIELLPDSLGGQPLLDHSSDERGHRFHYRGEGSSIELWLCASLADEAGRLDSDEHEPLLVQGFRGRWSWDPDTLEARAWVRLGAMLLELHAESAATRETVLVLLAELDLGTLAAF